MLGERKIKTWENVRDERKGIAKLLFLCGLRISGKH